MLLEHFVSSGYLHRKARSIRSKNAGVIDLDGHETALDANVVVPLVQDAAPVSSVSSVLFQVN